MNEQPLFVTSSIFNPKPNTLYLIPYSLNRFYLSKNTTTGVATIDIYNYLKFYIKLCFSGEVDFECGKRRHCVLEVVFNEFF